MTEKFKIITEDGIKFDIEKYIIDKSSMLKKLLFEHSCYNGNGGDIMKVKISGEIMTHIITMLKSNKETIYKNYIDNLNGDVLYELIIGAEYLNFKEIVHYAGLRIKESLKKSPEDVVNKFNLL